MFIFAFNPEYFCPQRLVYEHDEQANKPQNHNKSQIQNLQKVIQRLATPGTARL